MPLPGSRHGFHECPAYYLRTAADVAALRKGASGDHLVAGLHASLLLGRLAADVESGAVRLTELPNKPAELILLCRDEQAARASYAIDKAREEARQRGA